MGMHQVNAGRCVPQNCNVIIETVTAAAAYVPAR